MSRNMFLEPLRTEWLCFVLLHLSQWDAVSSQEGRLGCSRTARAFDSFRLSAYNIPQNDIPGSHLQICSGARTCCTEGMELQLSDFTRHQVDEALRQTVQTVADDLGSQGTSFDNFFRRLMNESRADLDAMFKRTYGVLYERNSFVFTDLFRDLEQYYDKGTRDLSIIMNDFFTVLYKRMFAVLNSQHQFDDQYLQCVATHMEGLQPFGDVPTKLTLQLKRSFVATRTLVQALHTGDQIVQKLHQVNLTPACGPALMKMRHCATCQGMPRLKACNGFCLNVLKGCLAHHSRLNDQWQEFIDGITDLITRLEGPFNIESVVSPINVKISGAIMNFQDSGYDVSRKIFEGCGNPKFRRRRQAGGELPSYSSAQFERVDFRRYPETNGEGLSPLLLVLSNIREKVRPLKTFWYDLPSRLCNDRDLAAPAARLMNCWNGTDKARYELPLMRDGIEAQLVNPEVPVDPLYTDSDVNDAIIDLKRATLKLRDAYNGQTVTWEQQPAEPDDGGSAGSDQTPSGGALWPQGGSGAGNTIHLLETGSGHHGDGAGVATDAELDDEGYYDRDYDGSGGLGYDDDDVGDDDYPLPDHTDDWPVGRTEDLPGDNDRHNEIVFETPVETNAVPDSSDSAGAGAAPRPRMSLARAVTIMVCPAIVTWIGNFI